MTAPPIPARHKPTLARAGVFISVVGLALASYAIPFLGFQMSLALPVVTHAGRRYLWPSASPRTSLLCSLLAWVGLWLPAIIDFTTAVFYDAGVQISTSWLIIPLCGPDSLAAWFLPALAAAAVATVGLAASTARGRPWAFLAAAWLAPWVHLAVFSRTPSGFSC